MIKLSDDLVIHLDAFSQGMADLAKLVSKLTTIPVIDLPSWMDVENNCYNYALNRKSYNWQQPGFIGTELTEDDVDEEIRLSQELSVEAYAHHIHKGALRDGLSSLGKEFSSALSACADNESPIALFFRDKGDSILIAEPDEESDIEPSHDFHWFALREDDQKGIPEMNRYLWAHKPALFPATICNAIPGEFDVADIFSEAITYNYSLFAGFYGVPEHLQRPPLVDNGLMNSYDRARTIFALAGEYADLDREQLFLESSNGNGISDEEWEWVLPNNLK